MFIQLRRQHQRNVTAGGGTAPQGRLQPPDPLAGGADHGPVVIEDDLVGLVVEAQPGQPTLVTQGPVPHSRCWLTPWRRRNLLSRCLARSSPALASARARTRLRSAS
jgi:hypothetical protein